MGERHVACAIAGGGPAGMMLGLLLAKAGVSVLVLEKHADFLRDFRGDTIHPSTMEVLGELGLLERFLALPHQPVDHLAMQYGAASYSPVDFKRLKVRCPFIAMMPQWDFLNFLAEEARKFPTFSLLFDSEVVDLVEEGGRVRGVVAETADGRLTVLADLVVGADGRSSVVREKSGFKVLDIGAPMDVLWFRLPRRPDDTAETQARFLPGRVFIMLNRGTYWQCAYVIAKGSIERIREAGLAAFRASVAALLPVEAGRAGEIGSWDDVKLLNVKVDRLERWAKPGLLFIGDAAHAMSPVGGVGINLAIQDAVAAANILAQPLKTGHLRFEDLAAVERRRLWPTRATQAVQVAVQSRMIAMALEGKPLPPAPLPLRLMSRYPELQGIGARMIGLGVRPEHVARYIREA